MCLDNGYLQARPLSEAQMQAAVDKRRVVSARVHRQALGQTEDVVDVMAREAGLSHPEYYEDDEDLEVEQLPPLRDTRDLQPAVVSAWGVAEDPLLR